jgi:hypothetical protein
MVTFLKRINNRLRIRDDYPGSRIRIPDPTFVVIPDPGSRIRIPDPGSYIKK